MWLLLPQGKPNPEIFIREFILVQTLIDHSQNTEIRIDFKVCFDGFRIFIARDSPN